MGQAVEARRTAAEASSPEEVHRASMRSRHAPPHRSCWTYKKRTRREDERRQLLASPDPRASDTAPADRCRVGQKARLGYAACEPDTTNARHRPPPSLPPLTRRAPGLTGGGRPMPNPTLQPVSQRGDALELANYLLPRCYPSTKRRRSCPGSAYRKTGRRCQIRIRPASLPHGAAERQSRCLARSPHLASDATASVEPAKPGKEQ